MTPTACRTLSRVCRHLSSSSFSPAFHHAYLAALTTRSPLDAPRTELTEGSANPQRILLRDPTLVAPCSSLRRLLLSPHSELKGFVTSSGERRVSTNGSDLELVLGAPALPLIDMLKLEVFRRVKVAFPLPIEEAGSILSWLSPSAETNEPAYSAVHCDKANNYLYDLSAILYLSSADEHFTGGELTFCDQEANCFVRPRVGTLVMFDAGLSNIHRVERVLTGDRLALSVWYRNLDPHKRSN